MAKKNVFEMPKFEMISFMNMDIITTSDPVETDKNGNVIIGGGDDFE